MAIVLVRTLIIYFALLVAMRLLGKRQLGEMELSEFVLAALIADLASHPLPLLNGLLPILILFCCEILIAGLTLKKIRLRDLIFGKPSLLIVRGQILQREMWKNRFTVDELMQELRAQSVTDISNIEYGVLETNGKLNVLLFPAQRPATAAQLGLDAGQGGYPSIVVSDGRVLEANLRHLGFDRQWLDARLRERGASSPEGVFLMTATRGGQIYYAAKEARP